MTLLTVKVVAARIQVKEKTVYNWASQGKIPCIKVNGVIRFDARDIEQWLQKGSVPAGLPRRPSKNRQKGSALTVDALIESAKRAVYTAHGETRPIASPFREEERNGAL